jgi:hypothetical protein
LTAAMILSGSAVHVKGFGSALFSVRKRLMAAWRSTTERKTPRFKRRLDSLAEKPSTALSHVWSAPSWQELSSRLPHWSVQHVFGLSDAVHITAGHKTVP